ncbi:MAG: XrtA/PEP-CTERM system histidine kinase PrsK [Sphingosinicella sp.]
MPAVITLWSHLLAAAAFGALAIFQLRHWNGDPLNRPLVTAFAVSSIWAIFLAMLDRYNVLTQLAESGRNLAFLAFMYGIMQSGVPAAGGGQVQRAVKAVYASVAAVVGLQIVIGGIISEYRVIPIVFEALASTTQVIGLTIAAGTLILVHNLYGQAAPRSRQSLRFVALAMTATWAYDLHLYTVGYFTHGNNADLFALRGLVLAMLAPLFMIGMRETASWKVQISRAATFQSLSVVAILAYLILMMTASRAMEIVGGDWGRVLQLGVLIVMTGVAGVLLTSRRVRSWSRVAVAKHMFEHRYDYREEWLRFTNTVGRSRDDGDPIEERVVRALADIGGSQAGLLLAADGHYRLVPTVSWNWPSPLPRGGERTDQLARFVEASAHVVDFAEIRDGVLVRGERRIEVPAWLAQMNNGWAGIPLIHNGRLLGLVVLSHPAYRRPLDWEDFDLFRAAGIQAASYIAEARGQQALADARRFDEFNRRFAFILHDIKNLVSQLSLVARNAERHAGNPDFQADMVATLQGSVKKMNELLVRLSPGKARDVRPPAPVRMQPLIESVVAARRRQHAVSIDGDARLFANADAAGLEQALAHLVQNAIEASPADMSVQIRFFESGGDVAIEVTDHGPGMSEDFVRDRLFQPFVSTKESGFGIGAYEARTLLAAMGGRLDVESGVGLGSRFTLFLPRAEAEEPRAFGAERKRA